MFLPLTISQSHNYCDLLNTTEDDNEVLAKEEASEQSEDTKDEKESDTDMKENESQQEEALFDPPLYKQRYSAVVDIINKHCAKVVIDMGCSEGQFISKVKDMCPSVEKIIGVDIDLPTLQRNSYRLKPLTIEYILKRERPLTLSLYHGSIDEPDVRFCGADVIACIEIIEHLYEETLENVPYSLFGVLRPKVCVITTPNCEYNVLFKNFSGMRHYDHKFEWTRKEFESWCANIVEKYPYDLEITGVGEPPPEDEVGFCSQMAIFTLKLPKPGCCSSDINNRQGNALSTEIYSIPQSADSKTEDLLEVDGNGISLHTTNDKYLDYDLVSVVVYPFDDKSKNITERIINETDYIINHFFSDISDETEECFIREISVEELLSYPGMKRFNISKEDILKLIQTKYSLSSDNKHLLVTLRLSDFSRDNFYSYDDLDEELSSVSISEVQPNEIEEDWD